MEKGGRVVVFTTHPYLTPRLKRTELYLYSPFWAFVAYFRVNFTFIFTFHLYSQSFSQLVSHLLP